MGCVLGVAATQSGLKSGKKNAKLRGPFPFWMFLGPYFQRIYFATKHSIWRSFIALHHCLITMGENENVFIDIDPSPHTNDPLLSPSSPPAKCLNKEMIIHVWEEVK